MIRPRLTLLIALAVALAACGKVGTLDRPGPLFGEKAKARYKAEQAAAAAAEKTRQDQGQAEPQPQPPQPQ